MRRKQLAGIVGGAVMLFGFASTALADPSPNGPGQPGAPGTTCGMPVATASPGQAAGASGSPFNESGTAGLHYAGNPDTASVTHAGSAQAVSQYDIACFQVTSH